MAVILVELFSDIRTDVPKPLLDDLRRLEGLLWRDTRLPLSQQLLNEVSDVTTGNGNVLDTTANYITFSLGGREGEGERERGNGASYAKESCKVLPQG